MKKRVALLIVAGLLITLSAYAWMVRQKRCCYRTTNGVVCCYIDEHQYCWVGVCGW